MGNKPILPSHGSHKADEDAVKKSTTTAAKIADKIVIPYLTAYFRAVMHILKVEDKGLKLSHKATPKNSPRKKTPKNPSNPPIK